jgi:hypothetical protein
MLGHGKIYSCFKLKFDFLPTGPPRMTRFFRWLASKLSTPKSPSQADLSQTGSYLRQTGRHTSSRRVEYKPAVPERQPEVINFDTETANHIEDLGPGKNVLIRKYVREDTGTHETLTILDDNAIDTDETSGIDPYNTGRFDRSKNWDKRSRKN